MKPKRPPIALVRNDEQSAPTPRPPWRRTWAYPSVDGTLVLAVRSMDGDETPVLFFVQLSIDTARESLEELVGLLEDFSLRHYPEPPIMVLVDDRVDAAGLPIL